MVDVIRATPGRRTLWRRGRGALGALSILFGGLVVLAYYVPDSLGLGHTTVSQAAPTAASAETARFLEAYAKGDEVSADAFASPLYRAEWLRRGLGVAARLAVRAAGRAEGEPRNSLEFRYVWGVPTELGYVHYLYSVRPVGRDGPTDGPYSVWRVDSDPQGRVIWLELVWLFGQETRKVVRVDDPDRLAAVPVPGAAETESNRPIVGVVSESTGEGHYLLGMKADRGSSTFLPSWLSKDYAVGGRNARVFSTYSVDSSGLLRPGAWTFGFGDQGLRPYGSTSGATPRLRVDESDAALLEGYLRTLG